MNADDPRIEPWSLRNRRGGPACRHRPHGIKVTHMPSGIEACVDIGQSQFANRAIAIKMIEATITHPRFRDLQENGSAKPAGTSRWLAS
jgi:protein subunit release factor A